MKYNSPYGVTDPNAPFINGNPSIGVQGSIPPAESMEYPQREIVNEIVSNGLTPNNGDLFQLTRAIRRQTPNFAIDTGVANALIASLNPSLNSEGYVQGMPLRVLAAHANTGATTITVDSIGTRFIKRPDGSDLQSGDIVAGMIASLLDTGSVFQLENALHAAAGSSNTFSVKIPFTADSSGAANTITAVFSPAITSAAEGDVILVKMANTVTGATQITVNALSVLPVNRNDGQPLQAFDLLAGETVLLENHATYYQVMFPVPSQYLRKFTSNPTIYIRTDGSDAPPHDGSLNDSAHAFATIQAAINYVNNNFLLNGRTVTFQLGNTGTYVGGVSINAVPGNLIIRGDPNNQDAYIISQGVTGVVGVGSGSLELTGVQLLATGAGEITANASNGGILTFGPNVSLNNTVGITGNVHLATFSGGLIQIIGNLKVMANASKFMAANDGVITASNSNTITITASTPLNFSQIAFAQTGGKILFGASFISWSGTWNGQRYFGDSNAVISVQGAGVNFFPGNVAGAVQNGAFYG